MATANPFSNAAPVGTSSKPNPFAPASSHFSQGSAQSTARTAMTTGFSNPFGGPSAPVTTAPFGAPPTDNTSSFTTFNSTKPQNKPRFGAPTQPASKRKPEPNGKPFGGARKTPEPNGTPFGAPAIPFGGPNKQQPSKPPKKAPHKPSPAPLSHLNGSSSSNPYASSIQQHLASNGIRPPKWPKDPDSNMTAMDNLMQKHKKYREDARTSLIKANLIDDPDKPKKLADALTFKGICDDMCPEYEKIKRIVQRDVKFAEKTDGKVDPSLMIKALARSAAGQEAPLPMDVLSIAACRNTLDYLLDDVLQSDDNLPTFHGFLWDRTRAIRRDFVFHSSTSDEEKLHQIYVLETIVRFHVVSLHLMSQKDFAPEGYSEKQEIEQLSKGLLSLQDIYKKCREEKRVKPPNEAEFVAYSIILYARDSSALSRVYRWGKELVDKSNEVRTAIALTEAIQNTWDDQGPEVGRPSDSLMPFETALPGYTTLFSTLEDVKVSYTMACFGEMLFGWVRQSILKTIHTAFWRPRIQVKDFTVDRLQRMLRFDTVDEVIEFVEKHGLEFDANDQGDLYMILVHKANFDMPHIPQSFSSLVEKKRSDRPITQVVREQVYEDGASQAVHETHEVQDNDDSLFVGNQPDVPPEAPSSSVLPSLEPKPPQGILSFEKPPAPAPPSIFPPPPNKSPNVFSAGLPTSPHPSTSPFNFTKPTPPLNSAPTPAPKPASQPSLPTFSAPAPTPADPPRPSIFPPPVRSAAPPSIFPAPRASTLAAPSSISAPASATPQPPIEPSAPAIPKPTSSLLPSSLSLGPPSSQTPPSSSTSTSAPKASTPSRTPSPKEESQRDAFDTFIPLKQSVKPKDKIKGFARWIALGDGGLLEQFLEVEVENLCMEVFAFYQDACDQKAAEEFRYNTMATRYGTMWRNITTRNVKRRQVIANRAKVQAWREKKIARDRESRLAEERKRKQPKPDKLKAFKKVVSAQQSSTDKQALKTALLGTGLLDGLRDPRLSAERLAHSTRSQPPSEISDIAETSSIVSGISSMSKTGKTARVLESLQQTERGHSNFRRSLPLPETKKRQSIGLDPYWMYKLHGQTLMPNGQILPEKIAKDIEQGRQYPKLYNSHPTSMSPPYATKRQRSASEAVDDSPPPGMSISKKSRVMPTSLEDGDEERRERLERVKRNDPETYALIISTRETSALLDDATEVLRDMNMRGVSEGVFATEEL
ncbi:leucine permease transcriptional regulator [Zalerion maritima]|uniref:Leucine permease transcriptional regulator n=1 Tax=Zalerion maritima TaxID=339359 RepID=A0AAD5RXH3_9PEZI|nr:leucine permease transcriptional regulator [Zalerion maritima]